MSFRPLSSLRLANLRTSTTPAPGVGAATMDKPTNNALTDGRRPGWLWIDNATLQHIGAEVGPYGIAVYAAIAMHTNGKGCKAWPGLKRIAEIAGCGIRKVRSTLRELEAAGALHVKQREGDTNLFTLLNVPPSDESADSGGGRHDVPGGAAQHAGGGGMSCPRTRIRNKNQEQEGGANAPSAPDSSPDSSSDDRPSDTSTRSTSDRANDSQHAASDRPEVEPILSAFRRSGATLTEKRARILLRWSRQGFIDNIPLFAEVVQDDLDGKGRILSMKVLRQKYIEAAQRSCERTARRNGRADAEGDHKTNAPVSHATASKALQEIRSDINCKAQLSEYFEVVKQDGTTKFKPTTPTAHAILSTQSQSQ